MEQSRRDWGFILTAANDALLPSDSSAILSGKLCEAGWTAVTKHQSRKVTQLISNNSLYVPLDSTRSLDLIDYEMIAAREAIAQSGAALLDVQASHVAIYLTILFAYMSVAYVAGKELTRFQLATVTFMFIAAAGREAYLISLFGLAARLKGAQLADVYEDSPAPSLWLGADNSIFWPVAIWSIGILASLIFMWSIRHYKDE